ncbi:hypothetical protein Q5H93_06180 [Hymenobacter sp. ASUV-10]|uniref:HTH HARE-type domain-containing protein n=1 Tax=Hymenobacter aranciens TaxID=3063996 RepID=A0ABT9B9H4_9BACT|nr:hypothetical protein [Hymenobacter sp. ASUV-10]MDO7874313.1 hypothetical protein [Hymenobacter sp. ASUV-10]
MLTYGTTLEKRIALQAFQESREKANAILVEAKEAYRTAQERYKTLTTLIDNLTKELDLEPNGTTSQDGNDITPSANTGNSHSTTGVRKKPPVKKPRKFNVREYLVELVKKGNAIVQTKDILATVREAKGKDFPASSVSGALAQLVKDGVFHRVRNDKANTSHYGLPEWFDGDVLKPEHEEVA